MIHRWPPRIARPSAGAGRGSSVGFASANCRRGLRIGLLRSAVLFPDKCRFVNEKNPVAAFAKIYEKQTRSGRRLNGARGYCGQIMVPVGLPWCDWCGDGRRSNECGARAHGPPRNGDAHLPSLPVLTGIKNQVFCGQELAGQRRAGLEIFGGVLSSTVGRRRESAR